MHNTKTLIAVVLGCFIVVFFNATFVSAEITFPAHGCKAANGIWACSPGNLNDCADTPACQGILCQALTDPSVCGQPITTVTPIPGGPPSSGGPGTGPGSGGSSVDFSLQPFGPSDFTELITTIITWLIRIAIPIAMIMIIWAGIILLTSGGNPGKVQKGKDILKYAVIGLVIIFIGRGFISLIKSILELGS